VLESYGIDLGKWGALNMHYMNYQNNLLNHTEPDYTQKYRYFTGVQDKWRNHFQEEYSSSKSDLSGDINF
jgi:triacylglycerol lipase